MIDFRYHIVSLVAVFLALALGLFLGSTTLQSTVTHSLQHQADTVRANNHDLEVKNSQLDNQIRAEQSFDAAVEPYAVAGKLLDVGVAVVSAPGVDDGDRSQLMTTLAEAGATVTADVRLQGGYLDPTQDSTWGQLAAQLAGAHALPRTNGAGQAAFELAKVLVNRPGTPLVSARRIETVLSTFSDAKMISVSGQAPVQQADLAILLVPLGSAPDNSVTQVAQNNDLIGVAQTLRKGCSGLVVAGPTLTPNSNGGALAAMRGDSDVTSTISTVDADDTAVGRVATVLALAAAPGGTAGRYGGSVTPPIPTASSTP